MKKTWLILVNEYKRHVLRKRFMLAILSMPLFVGLTILIGFLSVWLQNNSAPIGYVDPYGLLMDPVQLPIEDKELFAPSPSVAFPNEDSARQAFETGEIQAYFILPENYMDSGEVEMYTGTKTGENAEGDFGDFLVINLLRNQPEAISTRLSEGNNMIIRSLDGTREMGLNNWLDIAMPIIAGILFIIVVNVSGNYLLQAVVEEKENRTIEILVTSVSPTQLMTGKVLGNLLVGLTQLVTWIGFSVLALMIAPKFIPMGEAPSIDVSSMGLMVATLLPAFVMVAAAMAAVGATATEAREAQQVAGWFTIPMVVPLWFVTAIMFNPNGALAVGMSLFPLTAPIALPMRAVFTTVPAWQIVLTVFNLCALAIFALWLSGRVFRLGMLRYGKRVKLSEAFKREKQAGAA